MTSSRLGRLGNYAPEVFKLHALPRACRTSPATQFITLVHRSAVDFCRPMVAENLARTNGIEPLPTGSEPVVLPLYEVRILNRFLAGSGETRVF